MPFINDGLNPNLKRGGIVNVDHKAVICNMHINVKLTTKLFIQKICTDMFI